MKQKERKKRLKSTAFNELIEPLDLGTYKVQRNRTTTSGYVAKSLTLPKIWADANHIKVGDEVNFTMERNGTLSVRKARDTPAVLKEVAGNVRGMVEA